MMEIPRHRPPRPRRAPRFSEACIINGAYWCAPRLIFIVVMLVIMVAEVEHSIDVFREATSSRKDCISTVTALVFVMILEAIGAGYVLAWTILGIIERIWPNEEDAAAASGSAAQDAAVEEAAQAVHHAAAATGSGVQDVADEEAAPPAEDAEGAAPAPIAQDTVAEEATPAPEAQDSVAEEAVLALEAQDAEEATPAAQNGALAAISLITLALVTWLLSRN